MSNNGNNEVIQVKKSDMENLVEYIKCLRKLNENLKKLNEILKNRNETLENRNETLVNYYKWSQERFDSLFKCAGIR